MEFHPHPDFRIVAGGRALSRHALREFFPHIAHFLNEWDSGTNEIVLRTSGSTGQPKVIRVSKRIMWHSAGATIEALQLKKARRALLALSPEYIAGKMMIVRAMRAGWELEVVSPSGNPLKNTKGEFDFAALVPLQASAALDELYRIRKLIVGGAQVPGSLREALLKVDSEIYETYGMTETVSHIALKAVKEDAGMFRALPGVTFSQDNRGCLIIHASEWGHDRLQTTDVVELPDSTHFIWLGRADFIINSGGIKVHPEKVERVLSHFYDAEIYVLPLPDETLGSRVVMAVENRTDLVIPDSLEGLTKYEIPKEIRVVKQFPRTAGGKIDRKALIDQISERVPGRR